MAGDDGELGAITKMSAHELRNEWRRLYKVEPPPRLGRDLLLLAVGFKIQERVHGGLPQSTRRRLRTLEQELASGKGTASAALTLKPGARLVRQWRGRVHTVLMLEDGFDYEGERFRSLTQIARRITGVKWSGPRFFGLIQPAPASNRTGEDHA
jgi:hypothetical protein